MPSARAMGKKASLMSRWMMLRGKAMTGNIAPVAALAMVIWLRVTTMIVHMNGFTGAAWP